MATTRTCGGCTACCKLMAVPELQKPRLEWCSLVQIGKGCGDYENRPGSCKAFECAWLREELLPDDERPDAVGAVMFFPENAETLQVHVDPHKPNGWSRGVTGKFVRAISSQMVVLVTIGDKRKALGPEDILRDMEVRVGEDLR